MKRAADLIEAWCKKRKLPGLKVERVQLEEPHAAALHGAPGQRGPSSQGDDTVVLYGHLDKQPEMVGWRKGLGPWEPVREGDKLYGRGGADDGYAAFASLTALELLRRPGHPARSLRGPDRGAARRAAATTCPSTSTTSRSSIGTPSLVVCLDSGCGDYERLWSTTSLRGLVGGDLVVEILREGVHSGDAERRSCRRSFRIARPLLSRLEDEVSGEIVPKAFHAKIPPERIERRQDLREDPRQARLRALPVRRGRRSPRARTGPSSCSTARGVRRSPSPAPRACPRSGRRQRAAPAHGAEARAAPAAHGRRRQGGRRARSRSSRRTRRTARACASRTPRARAGWNAPQLEPWLETAVDEASKAFFGKPAAYDGRGRHDPVHGHARRASSRRRSSSITGVLGPRVERPRPERVPARADGEEADGRRGLDRGRPLHARLNPRAERTAETGGAEPRGGRRMPPELPHTGSGRRGARVAAGTVRRVGERRPVGGAADRVGGHRHRLDARALAYSGTHQKDLADHLDRLLVEMGHRKVTSFEEQVLATELAGVVPRARSRATS